MKTSIWSIILFFLSVLLVDTNAQETESLINIPTDFRFNGFAEVQTKYSNLIDENATYVGFKGGTAINSVLGLGVTAGGFVTENHFSHTPVDGADLNQLTALMGYTGFFVEYIALADKKIHFTIPVSVGPGLIAIFEQEPIADQSGVYNEDMLEYTGFLVLEPAINMEINIIKEVKFIVGGGYRWVTGTSLDILTDDDLSGFNVNIGLRLASY